MAEHKTLAEALAAFQAELPKLTKDEKAKVKGETKEGRAYDRSYGYADLSQVVETVLPVLGKHGLSVTSSTHLDANGAFTLEVVLLHEGGDRETSAWPLPDPRRSGPQDIGSAMTYGRRYLTLALTGTYPGGEDDDGQKAQQSARESWDDAKPARPQQANRPVSAPPAAEPKPVKTSWTDAEVRGMQAKLSTVPLDSAVRAYDWMAGKSLHNRKIGDPEDAAVPLRTATDVVASRLGTEALSPDATVAAIEGLKIIADARGLLKVQVSETETLDQVLYEARELAAHEAAKTDTPDPGRE